MIPAFLRAVGAKVRALVSANKAVRVTEADAVELEMIAGLEWDACANRRRVQPADIALGWLKCSRAIPTWPDNGCPAFSDGLHEIDGERILRAAACAELAAICVMLDKEPSYLPCAGECDPWEGTVEGARAAWSFIAEDIFKNWGSAASEIKGHPAATADLSLVKAVHDRYRRELEAMK